jgi:hypothetical protein
LGQLGGGGLISGVGARLKVGDALLLVAMVVVSGLVRPRPGSLYDGIVTRRIGLIGRPVPRILRSGVVGRSGLGRRLSTAREVGCSLGSSIKQARRSGYSSIGKRQRSGDRPADTSVEAGDSRDPPAAFISDSVDVCAQEFLVVGCHGLAFFSVCALRSIVVAFGSKTLRVEDPSGRRPFGSKTLRVEDPSVERFIQE